MPRFLLCISALLLALVHAGHSRGAQVEVCVQRNGVEICTLDKGFFAGEHIFGQSSTLAVKGLHFQVVALRIRNLTTRTLSMAPENFQGEAESGERYVIDSSLHDSINWPQKLAARRLHPNETMEGDLIFPVITSPVRRIVHNGHPYMEMVLY